jgi:uncharacterized protein (UPF0305 family)
MLRNIPDHYFDLSHEGCGEWCKAKGNPTYTPTKLPHKQWLKGMYCIFFDSFYSLARTDVTQQRVKDRSEEIETSLLGDIRQAINQYATEEILKKILEGVIFYLIFIYP